MDIQNLIINLRENYVSSDKAPSLYEINNGLCDTFAMELIALLGGYRDNLFELCGENFMIGLDGNEDENDVWCSNLLEDVWNIKPPCELNWEQINLIPFGTHCWIYYDGKHYDAECSEGVINFFELPLFKRYILDFCSKNGLPHDEKLQLN